MEPAGEGNERTRTITKVWNDKLQRKIFLEIVNQTQLRKCRQLRAPFIREVQSCINRGLADDKIYDHMKAFIDHVPPETRRYIQHQGHYRGLNRSNKIIDFARQHGPTKVERVLDVGCGDGSITRVLKQKLGLEAENVHGCDICPIETKDFTFSAIAETSNLPYPDCHFDIVYALMSLHHIRHLDVMLTEINRVLKVGGLLIVREHDCISPQLSEILDIVHGFYSMVWCSPREHVSFHDEYYGKYRTAREFDAIISDVAKLVRVTGTNRDEQYPSYFHGKIVNPMKHYWAVYSKSDSGVVSTQSGE